MDMIECGTVTGSVSELTQMADQSVFSAKLSAARLTQVEFRALVQRLTGKPLGQTTTSRWMKGGDVDGGKHPPLCALALLTLVAKMSPEALEALLRDTPKPTP